MDWMFLEGLYTGVIIFKFYIFLDVLWRIELLEGHIRKRIYNLLLFSGFTRDTESFNMLYLNIISSFKSHNFCY